MVDYLIKQAEARDDLTKEEKWKIHYYLTDEDFANERFAIIDLVKMILKEK
jgi:hypothetical protein